MLDADADSSKKKSKNFLAYSVIKNFWLGQLIPVLNSKKLSKELIARTSFSLAQKPHLLLARQEGGSEQ